MAEKQPQNQSWATRLGQRLGQIGWNFGQGNYDVMDKMSDWFNTRKVQYPHEVGAKTPAQTSATTETTAVTPPAAETAATKAATQAATGTTPSTPDASGTKPTGIVEKMNPTSPDKYRAAEMSQGMRDHIRLMGDPAAEKTYMEKLKKVEVAPHRYEDHSPIEEIRGTPLPPMPYGHYAPTAAGGGSDVRQTTVTKQTQGRKGRWSPFGGTKSTKTTTTSVPRPRTPVVPNPRTGQAFINYLQANPTQRTYVDPRTMKSYATKLGAMTGVSSLEALSRKTLDEATRLKMGEIAARGEAPIRVAQIGAEADKYRADKGLAAKAYNYEQDYSLEGPEYGVQAQSYTEEDIERAVKELRAIYNSSNTEAIAETAAKKQKQLIGRLGLAGYKAVEARFNQR